MSPDELTRRRFLGAAAGGAAALWLTALDAPPAPAAPNGARTETYRGEPLATLTTREAADLDALAAQIVPSEPDGLGAREAGSVFFIDRGLATFAKAQRPLFATGLGALRDAAAARGGRSFAALPAAGQLAVLHAMEDAKSDAKSEFFAAARAAVLAGLLADPKHGGNRGRVGWRLIGFENRFHWTAPFGWYDARATDAD